MTTATKRRDFEQQLKYTFANRIDFKVAMFERDEDNPRLFVDKTRGVIITPIREHYVYDAFQKGVVCVSAGGRRIPDVGFVVTVELPKTLKWETGNLITESEREQMKKDLTEVMKFGKSIAVFNEPET